jgi:hypothetical protein
MDNTNDGKGNESRPPSLSDLVNLCQWLNDAGARYIVIGGMAMIEAGFVRATEDIDLLIDASRDNEERIRTALMKLPDQAVREIQAGDLEKYAVIRVADEIVVDLMLAACGVQFDEAKDSIEYVTIEDVRIPFASPELLWKLKQTMREKDKLDLMFLKELLKR